MPPQPQLRHDSGYPIDANPPPAYTGYPPQGYEQRPPPSGPGGAGGYGPPPGPPPGQYPQPPSGDGRGLGGLAVGLGAAALVGNHLSNQGHGPPQGPGGATPTPAYAGAATGLGRTGSTREDPLTVLKRFDTVLLIDDSASMTEEGRWHEAEAALQGLVEKVVLYDSDGVDVYFLNSPKYLRNARSAGDVAGLFRSVQPVGQSTPTEVRVEELLGAYLDYIESQKAAQQPAPKPLNLIVITDGMADDDYTLGAALANFAARLDDARCGMTQLGVQFLQVGRDRQATEWLKKLDNDLKIEHGLKRDMVDTVPFSGRIDGEFIVKALLGGINKRIDRD